MNRTILRAAVAASIAIGMAPAGAQYEQRAPQHGPAPAVKGPAVALQTITLGGTVKSIDRASRTATIEGDGGRAITLRVGPDVRNFENLKQGDRVTARYTEATALALAEGGVGSDQRKLGEIRTKVEADAVRRAQGNKPGISAIERTTLVANVFDIDREKGILTLRGTDGVPVDIRVPDKHALEQISKDDQLVISYVQAAAVSIEPRS